ncbi:MAG: biotin transporter BioY [Actinobacteria bacterium]|nr:biotin transporter BioY [Actinomycetota bacterium]
MREGTAKRGRSYFSVREITVIGLFAAMIAASAWITIPLGTVPITLQVFAVLLAGLLLRPVPALAAIGAYLLLGAAGVPVFANFASGMGVLLGPTGGYLFGFAAAALLVSLICRALVSKIGQLAADAIGCAVGIVVIYLLGWFQLMMVLGLSPSAAFVAGVAPFIALDAAKAVVAVGVAASLRRAGVAVVNSQA